MHIQEVTTFHELKRFVSFQYTLYRTNRYWVPPPYSDEINSLRKDKNPAFDFCDAKYWIAEKDGKIVGRIAGIINKRYNKKWNAKTARFGWFDFIDDVEISSALLAMVEQWAKANGMTTLHGPLGFTDMDGEGALVEGFEEVSTLGSLYNYHYYPKYIEQAGYVKDADWIEYEVTMRNVVNEEIRRVAEIVLKRNNLSVLKVKKAKELLPYGKEIFQLLNQCYKNLYGFVELSDKQIDLYIKQYFGFILPEYVPVVLDRSGAIVAFGITMPSMSRAFQKNKGRLWPFGFLHVLHALKHNTRADLYLTAVRPDLQNKGVNAILMHEVDKVFVKNHIEKVETNRELETNSKVQAQWKYFDKRQHKRRRSYKKELI